MSNWIKKQLTELTAWGGFIICASVFFTPDWITFLIGVLLVAIDDQKAQKFITWALPSLSKLVDDVGEKMK